MKVKFKHNKSKSKNKKSNKKVKLKQRKSNQSKDNYSEKLFSFIFTKYIENIFISRENVCIQLNKSKEIYQDFLEYEFSNHFIYARLFDKSYQFKTSKISKMSKILKLFNFSFLRLKKYGIRKINFSFIPF